MTSDDETLYVVWLAPERADGDAVASGPSVRRLDDGLYLVRSDRTRSQLYHDVKRRTSPEKLLVAPLSDEPKFKGMAAGALKWLRAG